MSSAFEGGLSLSALSAKESEPTWLYNLRTEAAKRVNTDGLPTSKTEAWRFTNLRSLLATPFQSTDLSVPDSVLAGQCRQWADSFLGSEDGTRVYLVNGIPLLDDQGRVLGAPDDIEVRPLSETLAADGDSLKPYLSAESTHFDALNDALFVDGLCITATAGKRPDKALHVVHITAPGETQLSVYPKILVIAKDNAELSLVETYLSKPGADELCTAVTEVHLLSGAKLNHLRVVEGNDSSNHLGSITLRQGRDTSYLSRSVVLGGKLVRVDIDAQMEGSGAECNLEGVYHAVGSEHVAHHTLITHKESHGASSEEYRGLIDDRAHAVFDGIIIVDRDTKGTSAHQQNHNLLLSDNATVNTKPHLEIDSDDLTASHGATIGSLSPEQLFFLRARGIDEDQARAILTFSFVRTILDRIESPVIRKRLLTKVISRLPYAGDASELV